MTDSDTTRYPAAEPPEPASVEGPPETPATAPPPPAPAWRPTPADQGRGALVFGAIILVVGIWFFVTRTLGFDLPDLDWGQLWPVVLIGLGGWIVYDAIRRRSN